MLRRPRSIVTALVFSCSVSAITSANAEIIKCESGDVECLIAAIHQANAHPSRTTIRLAGGTYVLTNLDNDTNGPNALPSITTRITIDADGATLARGPEAPFLLRLLHVGPTGDLTLNGATVRGGRPRGGSLFNAGRADVRNSVLTSDVDGGSVFNDHGTLSIVDSTFEGIAPHLGYALENDAGVVDIIRTTFDRNRADGGTVYSKGGEVHISEGYFQGNGALHGTGGVAVSAGGTASIDRTTFIGNRGDGVGAITVEQGATVIVRDSALIDNEGWVVGGISIESGGTAQVSNTTFAGNRMFYFCEASAILNAGTITLVNSTFVDHKPVPPLPSPCSSLLPIPVIRGVDTSTSIVQNTIVYSIPDPLSRDCAGVITSLGNNLFSDPSGCDVTLQNTDLVGEARLGAVSDDGTPGNAHVPLLPDSPAIDAANNAACPKKDQLGRPRKPRCDIGAVEFR
jgi:hypothetical protein